MTNKEIRALALEKRGTARGLVPVTLLYFGAAFALEAPLLLMSYRGAGINAMLFYYVALLLFIGLVGGAGVARASLSAWNTGVARPGDLFSSFTDGRRFLRALAPVLIIVALALGWMYLLRKVYGPYMESMIYFTQRSAVQSERVVIEFSPAMYAIPLAGLALGFGAIIVGQLYFAIHLWPETPVAAVLWRGGKRAMGAVGRVICMAIATVWKPVLILYGAMIVGFILGAFMGMIAFLCIMILLMVGMLVYLLVRLTPYLMLAFAGLAIDVFGEKPEETE